MTNDEEMTLAAIAAMEEIEAASSKFNEDNVLVQAWADALKESQKYAPPRLPPEVLEPMVRASELDAWIKTFSDEIDRVFFEERPAIPPRGRIRYVLMLRAIYHYFSLVGFSQKAQTEVLELALALQELDHGTIREFLQPTPAQNRPIDPGDMWVARAYIAIAIDHMVSLGSSRRSACEVVAKDYNFLQYTLAPKSRKFITAIEGWCRSFQSGTVKVDRAMLMFEDREKLISRYMDDLQSKGIPVEPTEIFNRVMLSAARCTAEASDADAIGRLMKDPRVARKKPPSKNAGN